MTNHTQITFSVPEDSYVNLYNIIGQRVYTFMSKKVKGNTKHTIHWNGVTKKKKQESRVYIYELITDSKKLRRKLLIKEIIVLVLFE